MTLRDEVKDVVLDASGRQNKVVKEHTRVKSKLSDKIDNNTPKG